MNKITFKNPIALIFESRICDFTIYVFEIRVLKSGKPYAVFTKDGKRYDFEHLTDYSKELVEKIVERNAKYL